MANITVSPTRMELTRLKGKLKTAQRGHKLLKDKRDELMKQFLDTVREVRSLRAEVEEDLMRVHKSFTVASALMSSEALEQALLYPKQSVELTRTTQNIMSVNVPVYDFQTKTKSDSDIYPYGFAATSGELDDAVEASDGIIPEDVKFAAGRLTVMEAGTVDCDEEVYDVSFKIWSTVNRAIGLFFCAEEDDTWELISCNLGDVIEGRFQSPGTYVIAVGW